MQGQQPLKAHHIVPESAQLPYLQVMAFISRILHTDSAVESLLKCTTADAMRKFFHSFR